MTRIIRSIFRRSVDVPPFPNALTLSTEGRLVNFWTGEPVL